MPNDELEIVKQARAAAERATNLIPREAWDAARRVGEMSDRLRLVPQQVVGRIMEQVQQANQRMSEMVRSLMRPAFEVVDVFRSPEMQDLIKRAQEAFARLPDLTRDTLQTLGMNGWYPDDEMTMGDLVTFAKGFDAGEEEKTTEALCQHFESRREAIINDLVAMAPLRETFLRTALEAHRDQKYELSIPLFLSQADGLWQDFTKADRETRLYSRRKGQPKTAKWVKTVKRDDLDEALLYPLVAPLPISAADGEVVPKGALVRHRVLHGTDLDYPSRLNSCRALSHLGYVGSVIRERMPAGSNSTP
jgi:hypothetical protein